MNIEILIKRIKNRSVVSDSLSMAEKYYIDPNPVRKEIKSLLMFSKKIDNMKLDIGFDLSFNVPNSDMTNIAKKMVINEQYRVRAVELYINLKKMLNRLNYIYTNSKNYIMVEYGALMSSMTKEAKLSLIDIVYEDVLKHKYEIEELIDDINKVLSAMDSAHFTLKEIKSVGEGIIQRTMV